MRTAALVIASLVSAAGCGDNLAVPDARPRDAIVHIDAAPDAPCAAGRYVGGELVDIDSTTAAHTGVSSAVFTQRGGTATTTSSSTGHFEMCVPSTTSYLFDVNAPGDYTDAIAYFEVEALAGGRPISFRTWTATRAASFYIERGLVYDPTKAQVLVFLAGDRSNLSLDRAHGTVQGANDDDNDGTYTWAAGQGRYVLFPNVDATNPTGTLIGDLSGQHTIPLEAGKITLAALFWVFL